jgi:hypothetical protein
MSPIFEWVVVVGAIVNIAAVWIILTALVKAEDEQWDE